MMIILIYLNFWEYDFIHIYTCIDSVYSYGDGQRGNPTFPEFGHSIKSQSLIVFI